MSPSSSLTTLRAVFCDIILDINPKRKCWLNKKLLSHLKKDISHLFQVKSSGTCFTCNLCVIKRYIQSHIIFTGSWFDVYIIILIRVCTCSQGEVQYFIGVQLDGSQHVEPLRNCIPEDAAKESEKLVSAFFECILHLFSVLSLGVWCQAYTMSVYRSTVSMSDVTRLTISQILVS